MPAVMTECFFRFIVVLGGFRVPVLFLAAWHIGWKLYEMIKLGNTSCINNVAHLSSAISGGLFGACYLVFKSKMLRAMVLRLHLN